MRCPPHWLEKSNTEKWKIYKEVQKRHGRNQFVSLEALNNFNQVNFQYRNFIKGNHWQYESSMIEKLGSAPKLFQSYIRKRKKDCPSVGPLRLEGGEVVADALQMSEHFVDSFSSVSVRSTPVISGEHQRFGRGHGRCGWVSRFDCNGLV